MKINGINFPTNITNIFIGDNLAVAHVLNVTSTQIVFVTPSLAQGIYSLLIPCGISIGYALYDFLFNLLKLTLQYSQCFR